MKYLINSKYLATKLKELDLDNEAVQDSYIREDCLTLVTESKKVEIILHSRYGYYTNENPKGARWDWVKDLVIKAAEQPIVIQFGEDRVDLIFQF